MSNRGSVCLFINSRHTFVLKLELSFVMLGIKAIIGDVYCDEISTIDVVYRRSSEKQ